MRMVGTGKDRLGRYPDGVVYDLPDGDDATIADHVSRGWGRALDVGAVPLTDVQIANAIVRGDPLFNDDELAVANRIVDRAHAIAHTSDPAAKQGQAHPRRPRR